VDALAAYEASKAEPSLEEDRLAQLCATPAQSQDEASKAKFIPDIPGSHWPAEDEPEADLPMPPNERLQGTGPIGSEPYEASKARWKCACGWQGNPEQMTANPSGHLCCPECGGSGGLVSKPALEQATPAQGQDIEGLVEEAWAVFRRNERPGEGKNAMRAALLAVQQKTGAK
jgi:hypothetical protein